MENKENRDNEPIIKLEHLTKVLSKKKILDDINQEFYGGKVYGIRGKNGSGKTMLMRSIAGLILPTDGHVVINGEIVSNKNAIPDSIGILLENPSFLAEYSGFKNLRLLADLNCDLSDSDIEELLVKVGLEDQMNKKYGEYSLGMKQRLGVAAAIMGEPQIVLLDEPINAIDGDGVAQICSVIHELRTPDHVIIVTCHDIEELEYLSDEIIKISEGKIIHETDEISTT